MALLETLYLPNPIRRKVYDRDLGIHRTAIVHRNYLFPPGYMGDKCSVRLTLPIGDRYTHPLFIVGMLSGDAQVLLQDPQENLSILFRCRGGEPEVLREAIDHRNRMQNWLQRMKTTYTNPFLRSAAYPEDCLRIYDITFPGGEYFHRKSIRVVADNRSNMNESELRLKYLEYKNEPAPVNKIEIARLVQCNREWVTFHA